MKTKLTPTQRLNLAQAENDVLNQALFDLCYGATKWFSRSNGYSQYSLGVSRPKGAMGGVVIVKTNCSTSAYAWESFYAQERETIAACLTGEDTEHNRELLRRRSCLDEAAQYVREQQAAR